MTLSRQRCYGVEDSPTEKRSEQPKDGRVEEVLPAWVSFRVPTRRGIIVDLVVGLDVVVDTGSDWPWPARSNSTARRPLAITAAT